MNLANIEHSDVWRWTLRYSVAVFAVFVGFGVRLGLERVFGGSLPTYITFYPAVMLVALLAGLGPGLLATAVTVLVVDYWILVPHGLFHYGAHPIDGIGQIFFVGMGLLMSAVAELYRRMRRRAADFEQKLQLRESQERLQLALDAANAGSWVWDIVSDTLEWSPELFRLFGLDPLLAKASFDHWRNVILPEDRPVAKGRLEQAIQKHERLVCEYRIVLPTGELRWINALGDTTFDPGGKAVRMSGICLDITERKRAQIREQEALAATAAAQTAIDTLEAMGEGVILTDMTGRIQSVNSALEQMSGYIETEIKGRTLEEILGDVIAEVDRGKALKDIANVRKGEKSAIEPLTLISKQGRRTQIMPAASFIRGLDGTPTGLVLTLKDISELRRTYEALEESERKYRELVENASSIIMRLTPDHAVSFFNEYAQAFFGYTADEVIGKSVVGTIVPPVSSDGVDLCKMLVSITENPEAYASNENENICKDGHRVWVHWTNRAVRDAGGNLREILCVGMDVTQRKRMESDRERYQQRLRELAERLASTEERERHRISTQIHDTVIQTLSLSNIKLGSVRKELAEAAFVARADEVNHVRELIEEAIKESRSLMAELTPPLLYELGLVLALQDLTERLQKLHGASIFLRDDGRPKPVDKALQGFLFHAVRELIMNALKHAGQCTITISLSRLNDCMRICVEDNGVGFKVPEAGSFVFHRSGGFGLFSIRERLDRIGGQLDVDSQPGKGTTATILVPLKPLSLLHGTPNANELEPDRGLAEAVPVD